MAKEAKKKADRTFKCTNPECGKETVVPGDYRGIVVCCGRQAVEVTKNNRTSKSKTNSTAIAVPTP